MAEAQHAADYNIRSFTVHSHVQEVPVDIAMHVSEIEIYENIEIINMISEMLGKTPKFEFVADRLGHDRRYALDSTKVRELFSDSISTIARSIIAPKSVCFA